MNNVAKMRVAKSLISEDGLALRFSEQYRNELRYIALKNQWLKWDGTRWAPEPTLLAFDLARKSICEYVDACKASPKLKKASVVSAIERMARADRRHAATLDSFDTNPMLFNAVNGTINLETGELQDHDPSDFITKCAACDVAPKGTKHPLFTAFLKRIFANNEDLIAFMQRWLGYCLTGLTVEHAFIFAYGSGSNGKGTLLNTVSWIFNDYATVADMGTFITTKSERHPTDIAKLHGARYVTSQETQQGRQWDEAKVKVMTGGDPLTGRFMRQDFFDFDPVFKLNIAGNHMPTIENVDYAMRRRFNLVPFTVQIGPEEVDPVLPEKLRTEGPAILRWMVDGCLEWRHRGLKAPDIVTTTTDAYFDEQDPHQQWMDDCVQQSSPTAFTTLSDLFASWKNWCLARGITQLGSSTQLNEKLVSRGYRKVRRNGGFGIVVVELTR